MTARGGGHNYAQRGGILALADEPAQHTPLGPAREQVLGGLGGGGGSKVRSKEVIRRKLEAKVEAKVEAKDEDKDEIEAKEEECKGGGAPRREFWASCQVYGGLRPH